MGILPEFLRLRIGPLNYEFVAHDSWGMKTFSHLKQNLLCTDFSEIPDRVIHLFDFTPNSSEMVDINDGVVPEKLLELLGTKLPSKEWHIRDDETGHVCWTNPTTHHGLWTFNTATPHFNTLFQLPWHILLDDSLNRNGGLLHCGLALFKGKGFIFLAPSGGGKTTTVSRLPSSWKVACDDLVFIWEKKDGSFAASPLPTGGVLAGDKSPLKGTIPWQTGMDIPLLCLIIIKQSKITKILPGRKIDLAGALYAAFFEHRRALHTTTATSKRLFQVACAMANRLQSATLELTLKGDFWKYLETMPSAGP